MPDRSTSELMRSFYASLKAGRPKDETLRAAQIDFIRGGGGRVWEDPRRFLPLDQPERSIC